MNDNSYDVTVSRRFVSCCFYCRFVSDTRTAPLVVALSWQLSVFIYIYIYIYIYI
jgi:hypothetical protein